MTTPELCAELLNTLKVTNPNYNQALVAAQLDAAQLLLEYGTPEDGISALAMLELGIAGESGYDTAHRVRALGMMIVHNQFSGES